MKQITILLAILLLVPLTTASFGVSSIYSRDRPLYLNPGETKETFLILQNPTEEQIVIKPFLISGSEIAQLTDTNQQYTLKPGQEVKVNLKIQAPVSSPQSEYKVGVLFKPEIKKSESTIQFITNIGILFPVIVSTTEVMPQQDLESKIVLSEGSPASEKIVKFSKTKTAVFIILSIAIAILIILTLLVIFRLRKITRLQEEKEIY